ncbi:tRNA-dihydrouridine synthase, partial [Escherichia coli]|nr:tRNA-dihydrouridine synthase [Escherichia coli]
MHDNPEIQKTNQTSVMPEKTGAYWSSRFSIAP